MQTHSVAPHRAGTVTGTVLITENAGPHAILRPSPPHLKMPSVSLPWLPTSLLKQVEKPAYLQAPREDVGMGSAWRSCTKLQHLC